MVDDTDWGRDGGASVIMGDCEDAELYTERDPEVILSVAADGRGG